MCKTNHEKWLNIKRSLNVIYRTVCLNRYRYRNNSTNYNTINSYRNVSSIFVIQNLWKTVLTAVNALQFVNDRAMGTVLLCWQQLL